MLIIHHAPAPPPFLFPHFIKYHGFNGNCLTLRIGADFARGGGHYDPLPDKVGLTESLDKWPDPVRTDAA